MDLLSKRDPVKMAKRTPRQLWIDLSAQPRSTHPTITKLPTFSLSHRSALFKGKDAAVEELWATGKIPQGIKGTSRSSFLWGKVLNGRSRLGRSVIAVQCYFLCMALGFAKIAYVDKSTIFPFFLPSFFFSPSCC